MNAATNAGRFPGFTGLEGAGTPMRAARAAAGALGTLELWLWRAHYRDELERLSDHQLRDIGLDRETVLQEARKPFWRA
jgi:uncharacterized protein YjiS (DUF1127 family)